ncbi:hypothetical protein E4U11_004375 [Claviceps purpurea]|nr:hypothetical protein E4U11_004375 [Claviceps purpurea]
MPPKKRNPSSGGARTRSGTRSGIKGIKKKPQKSVSVSVSDGMEAAVTSQISKNCRRDAVQVLVDPNLRSDITMMLGTCRSPERISARDSSEICSERSQPESEVSQDVDSVGDAAARVERGVFPTMFQRLCLIILAFIKPIVKANVLGLDDRLDERQYDKAQTLKHSWKNAALDSMVAFTEDRLDERSAEDQPTETAAEFAAATSRDSATKLLTELFSLDRFEDIFRFTSYLNLAESNAKVHQWCEFLWEDLGHVVLLSRLKLRGITLDLDPDDDCKFDRKAIIKRWSMYGNDPDLDFMRPTSLEVSVRSHLRTSQAGKKTSKPTGTPHKNTFNTSRFIQM